MSFSGHPQQQSKHWHEGKDFLRWIHTQNMDHQVPKDQESVDNNSTQDDLLFDE